MGSLATRTMPPVVPRHLAKLHAQADETEQEPAPIPSDREGHQAEQCNHDGEHDENAVRLLPKWITHADPLAA